MRLVAVLGYSDGRSDELHPVCAARLALAARLAGPEDAVVLTGWARKSGRLAESELMRRSWPGPGRELVCDAAARITAENAAYVGKQARRLRACEVVVVTSWWHRPRAALLFRAFLGGLPVTVASTGRPWSLGLLAREAAAFALLPLHLGRARRADSGSPTDSTGLPG